MRSANFLSKFQRSISLNFLEALYETLQSIIFPLNRLKRQYQAFLNIV